MVGVGLMNTFHSIIKHSLLVPKHYPQKYK